MKCVNHAVRDESIERADIGAASLEIREGKTVRVWLIGYETSQ